MTKTLMMNLEMLRGLERRIYNLHTYAREAILENHIYVGMEEISSKIESVFTAHLLGAHDPYPDLFEPGGTMSVLLDEGDNFYRELIRSANILNANNRHLESEAPLRLVVNNIYQAIGSGKQVHVDQLSIYQELETQVLLAVGKKLASNATFQTLDQWEVILEKLHHSDILYAWKQALSLPSIKAQSQALLQLPVPMDLANMAFLHGFGSSNDGAVKDYLQRMDTQRRLPAFYYMEALSEHWDMLMLKGNLDFKATLLRKLSLSDWLTYVDGLHFPCLQSCLLQSVDELDDFSRLVELITSRNDLVTPKAHLLALVFQAYHDFLHQLLSGLMNFQRYGQDSAVHEQQVAAETLVLSSKLKEELIPRSAASLFKLVFDRPDADLAQSICAFDWVASHKRVYLTEGQRARETIVGLLREALVNEYKNSDLNTATFFNRFAGVQLNWELLSLFRELWLKQPSEILRDTLLEGYNTFIARPDFFFACSDEEANRGVVLNHAYNLSALLSSHADGIEKWRSLYLQYRIYHEGWMENTMSDRVIYREVYLLLSGLGIAYWLLSDDNESEGRRMLDEVQEILLRQLRAQCERVSSDYSNPLFFLGLILAQYLPKLVSGTTSRFIEELDSLESLLFFGNGLYSNTSEEVLSGAVAASFRARITLEFPTIERIYGRVGEGKIARLNHIKDHILSKLP